MSGLTRSLPISAVVLVGMLTLAGCAAPPPGSSDSGAQARVSGVAKVLARIAVPAGCVYLQTRMEQILDDASASDERKAERLEALRPLIPASCGALLEALDGRAAR